MAVNRRDKVFIKKTMEVDGETQTWRQSIPREFWDDERQSYQKNGWALDVPGPVGTASKFAQHGEETEATDAPKAKKAKVNVPN